MEWLAEHGAGPRVAYLAVAQGDLLRTEDLRAAQDQHWVRLSGC
jgi:hypothetical protein